MPQFNATDAIFFGFRLFKRDPLIVLGLVVFTTVTTVIGVQLVWAELAQFKIAMDGALTETDEALAQQAMASAYGGFFGSLDVWAYLILMMAASVVVQAGALRVLVFERRGGWFFGMQLAGDEGRLFVISLALGVLIFVVAFVALLVSAVAASVLTAVNSALGAGAIVVFGAGAVLVTLLVGVRFCAAAPAAIGENKLVLLGSWTLTKGRAWGLLGAFVILFFILMVGAVAIFSISSFLAPQAMAILNGATPVTALDDAGAVFLSPGYIFVTFLNATVSVAATIGYSGVGAYAYRMLGGAAGYANAQPPQDASSASTAISS